MTLLDSFLTAGLILGATMIVVGVASYNPDVEVFPGRTVPRSQAEKTLAMWDAPKRGREAKWINPDPKPSRDHRLFGYR